MKRINLSLTFILAFFIPLLGLTGDLNSDKEIDDVSLKGSSQNLQKPASFADEAVGVMDKGQLQNLTMNYGQVTDTRYEDVGNAPTQYFFDFRYPRKDFTGVCDDFALFFAVPENTKNGNNGNVIDGWTDNDNEDWIAKDGAYGKTHYNPATDANPHAPILYPPDNPTTPYLAHSDLPATWPIDDNGQAFWPGYFQRDRITGEEKPGEFASDRDVYAVFDDSHNQQGNPIGIDVEMMAYCYGRPYADKFQFYEFFIHNKSGKQVTDCWVGYYMDPDCSDHGEEILILPDATFSDPNTPDIILQRDIDGDHGGATRPNSKGVLEDYSFGIAILETPKDMGVTSFHYYADSGPTADEILWPIITSDPTDSDISGFATNYFHGSNTNFDDISLLTPADKQDLVFIVASGPFTMEPDEVVKPTIVVAVGEDDADFYAQIDQALQMFDFKFVGPSAPPAPSISVVKGDGQVTLYWDAIAETKPDPFTNDIDFEGYRIYRSEDNGQTWGKELIDAQGNLIGYFPIAQFDLENGILGPDPRNPFTYLGNDSGIKHTFVDMEVNNGISYSYTIVAYDRGDSLIFSLESARGTSVADRNFVTITPEPDPSGTIPAEVKDFTHSEGNGKAIIDFKIIDDDALIYDKLELQFNGTPATSFELVNTATPETLASNLPLNFEDNPVVAGFQVTVQSDQKIGGIESVTDGFGINVEGAADSSKSWQVSIDNFPLAITENLSRDYEIRFTETGSIAYSWGTASSSVAAFPVDFEVWEVTIGDTQQIEFQVNDLNANQQWDEGENILVIRSTYTNPQINDPITATFPDDFTYNVIISNFPDDTLFVPPQKGDVVKINSYRSVREDDVFSFNLKESTIDQNKIDLSEIRVVPNPYIVGAKWEELQNVHRIMFMFLPSVCTIDIYTISGEKVASLNHREGGQHPWNLNNLSNQAVAFGVYVYVVKTPQGDKYTGKFAVIR